MSRFLKGLAAVIITVGELAVIILAGCTQPLRDVDKSAHGLLGNK